MTEEIGFHSKCEENSEKKKKRKDKHQQQQNPAVKEKVNEEENEENSEKKKRKNKHQQQELEQNPAEVIEKENEEKLKEKEKTKNKHHKQQLEQNHAVKEKLNEEENEEKSNEKESIKENTEKVNKDNKKKRKRKEVFPFGNYRSYYGYRIGQGMDEDPRLSVFDRKWFEGKDCLDIGCNSGIVTIQIAKKFHCRKILGIDIDSDRIADAYWHLRKIVRAGQNGNTLKKASEPDKTRNKKGSKDSTTSLPEENQTVRDSSHPGEIDLFDAVSFKKENFVQSWCHQEEQYDTILCLSVTKWIHLNWGDEGLITTFSKIWKLLRPGGILVLEPQPWKSYESNRLVSETVTRNYRNIIFRPHHFEEILLDKIGFRMVEDLTSALSGTKAGFDRPIFAYHK